MGEGMATRRIQESCALLGAQWCNSAGKILEDLIVTRKEFKEIYSRLILDIFNINLNECSSEDHFEEIWKMIEDVQNKFGHQITIKEYESLIRPIMEERHRKKEKGRT